MENRLEGIRKIVTIVEETYEEGGKEVIPSIKKAAIATVVRNSIAGKWEEDLGSLIELGGCLGQLLIPKLINMMGGDVNKIESFGKAVIVGADGELEHGAAILHPRLGTSFREALNGKAIVPSTKTRGGLGHSITVPLHYKMAAFVRSHFDSIEVRVADAPRANELVVILAVADGGRPHPRIGGLQKTEAKGEDGLR